MRLLGQHGQGVLDHLLVDGADGDGGRVGGVPGGAAGGVHEHVVGGAGRGSAHKVHVVHDGQAPLVEVEVGAVGGLHEVDLLAHQRVHGDVGRGDAGVEDGLGDHAVHGVDEGVAALGGVGGDAGVQHANDATIVVGVEGDVVGRAVEAGDELLVDDAHELAVVVEGELGDGDPVGDGALVGRLGHPAEGLLLLDLARLPLGRLEGVGVVGLEVVEGAVAGAGRKGAHEAQGLHEGGVEVVLPALGHGREDHLGGRGQGRGRGCRGGGVPGRVAVGVQPHLLADGVVAGGVDAAELVAEAEHGLGEAAGAALGRDGLGVDRGGCGRLLGCGEALRLAGGLPVRLALLDHAGQLECRLGVAGGHGVLGAPAQVAELVHKLEGIVHVHCSFSWKTCPRTQRRPWPPTGRPSPGASPGSGSASSTSFLGAVCPRAESPTPSSRRVSGRLR